MTIIGSPYGVGFEFDEHGLWCSVVVGRHRTRIAIGEALATAPGAFSRPLPVFPIEGSALGLDAERLGLDPATGYEATQTLAGGRRTLQVFQGRWQQGGGLGDVDLILGRAMISLHLEQPTTWRITFPAGCHLETRGDQVVAFHNQGVVRLRPIHPLTVEPPGTVRLDLPAGDSQVEVWVENRPAYPVANTVILCTPTQMREAAVVATCTRQAPADRRYIPVLDLSLPPAAAEEFQAGNEKLKELLAELRQVEQAIQRQAAGLGGGSGGVVLPTGSAANQQVLADLTERHQTLLEEISALQDQVLGFASWSRHWQRLLRLIAAVAPPLDPAAQRIAILYPYPPPIIAALPPQAHKYLLLWDRLEEIPAYPPDARVTVIHYQNLDDLATRAWEALVGGRPPGRFTIPDDPRFYPLGVMRALDLGKPLSPRGRAGSENQLEAAMNQVNQNREGAEEIVVVEADGSVGSLSLALYAHHADRPLYVHPVSAPDQFVGQLGLIQENIEKEVLARSAGEAFRYISEHKQAFLQDQTVDARLRQLAQGVATLELPRAMGTPYAPALYIQMLSQYERAREAGIGTDFRYQEEDWQQDLGVLERIATSRVSNTIRKKARRARRVTVYTPGVPYTFVEGWQDKAIGHLVLEAPLMVLRGVLNQAITDPPLVLAEVLDAGFLDPLPGTAFTDRLDGPGHAVVYLRDSQASPAVLQMHARFLPVAAVLLHTQGTPRSVVLWAGPNQPREVLDLELEMNTDLLWGPLVFNHGYMSWLGLGPALLRAGARAFIAPLWSPESEPAREMALQTFSGALAGQPFAQALAAAQVEDVSTRRAYICLGLAGTALQPAPPDPVAGLDLVYSPTLTLLDMGLLDAAQDLYERYTDLAGKLQTDTTSTIELALRQAYYLLRRARRDDPILARQARERCREARDRLPAVANADTRRRLEECIAALEAAAQAVDESRSEIA